MSSVEQQLKFPHAVWLEEAFHKETQENGQLLKGKEYEYEWSEPESKSKITVAQDSFCHHMKRKTTREEESRSSLVLVRQFKLLLGRECSVAFKSNEDGSA